LSDTLCECGSFCVTVKAITPIESKVTQFAHTVQSFEKALSSCTSTTLQSLLTQIVTFCDGETHSYQDDVDEQWSTRKDHSFLGHVDGH
jgi:hypothetical protein